MYIYEEQYPIHISNGYLIYTVSSFDYHIICNGISSTLVMIVNIFISYVFRHCFILVISSLVLLLHVNTAVMSSTLLPFSILSLFQFILFKH